MQEIKLQNKKTNKWKYHEFYSKEHLQIWSIHYIKRLTPKCFGSIVHSISANRLSPYKLQRINQISKNIKIYAITQMGKQVITTPAIVKLKSFSLLPKHKDRKRHITSLCVNLTNTTHEIKIDLMIKKGCQIHAQTWNTPLSDSEGKSLMKMSYRVEEFCSFYR